MIIILVIWDNPLSFYPLSLLCQCCPHMFSSGVSQSLLLGRVSFVRWLPLLLVEWNFYGTPEMGTGILDAQSSTNSNRSIIKMASAYSTPGEGLSGRKGDKDAALRVKSESFPKARKEVEIPSSLSTLAISLLGLWVFPVARLVPFALMSYPVLCFPSLLQKGAIFLGNGARASAGIFCFSCCVPFSVHWKL